jgi:SAM-dependent methyltransferase
MPFNSDDATTLHSTARQRRWTGKCPVCDFAPTTFDDHSPGDKPWYRDYLACGRCGSVPRERALRAALERFFPEWRKLTIHESSPGTDRQAHQKIRSECVGYSFSYYYPEVPLGEMHPATGYRSENLERLTFEDRSLDLFLTSDVMEHVFDPTAAFREIGRVLKPGGAHVFVVPLDNGPACTERCAELRNGRVVHLPVCAHPRLPPPPIYHGDPTNEDGALQTFRWGYDICSWIYEASGMASVILDVQSLELGIAGQLAEAVVSFKTADADEALK